MTDPTHETEVAAHLLSHLREAAGFPNARYSAAPVRVLGGNQTFVYGLQLEGVDELEGPAILRILRPFLPAESVRREAVVQEVLCDLGYPVARVIHHCSDTAVLGGAFQLMERLPGGPLVLAGVESEGTISLRSAVPSMANFVFGSWPARLAGLHCQLHALSVDQVLPALEEAGLDPAEISLEAHTERIAQRADDQQLDGLRDAFDWLRARRGLAGCDDVLCHGDFFPNQVMNDDGRLAVIDWSDACIAPAEFDVGIVKVGLETLPVPLGALGRRIVVSRGREFFEAYERERVLDPAALTYVEAFRCTHSLLAIAERRRSLSQDPNARAAPNPYDTAAAATELSERVWRITGCRIELDS